MLVRGFQFMTANSPMTSPEHSAENEPNVTPQSRRGRKKMRRDRSKAYRKIAQLEKSIKEKERVIARYKKRMQRDRKRKEKVKGNKDVLLHNVLLQGIQSRMNGQIDERGRHVVGQLMPTEELKRNKLARKYSRETGISRRRLGKKTLKLGDYAKEGRTVIWRINMKRKRTVLEERY